MKKKILLVDDDALMRRSLAFNLQNAGFEQLTAGSAEEGLQIASNEKPDLVILDIGLPGMDGMEALKKIQTEIGSPVIFLTARRREIDQVLGLELGADDYVTKPFDFDVLLARIRAVLRRTQAPVVSEKEKALNQKISAGDIQIDLGAHTVHIDGKIVDLSPIEFDLLCALVGSAGKLVTSEQLLDRVWGAEYEGEPQVVYVHINNLRRRIEKDVHNPLRIITIPRLGYKLEPIGKKDE